MIPVGYMAKKVIKRPDRIKAERVEDIYSVSNCGSNDFADYINYWKHNGFWFFDSPEIIQDVAKDNKIDMSGNRFFYYEAFDKQYDEAAQTWNDFKPEASFTTNVLVPILKTLEGYDVVTFSGSTDPGCSPLSCNNLAESIDVNEHCLLPSFEEAKALLEGGAFNKGEPGPYRIFAVYSLPEN